MKKSKILQKYKKMLGKKRRYRPTDSKARRGRAESRA